jgi:hypothetical protein
MKPQPEKSCQAGAFGLEARDGIVDPADRQAPDGERRSAARQLGSNFYVVALRVAITAADAGALKA